MASPKLNGPSKKLKSKVWNYFGFREGSNEDNGKATCKTCYMDVSYHKSGSTTNLMQHMKRKHNVEVLETKVKVEPLRENLQVQGTSSQPKITDLRQKLTVERSRNISNSIAGFLAQDMRPYSTVDSVGFKNMVHMLEPRYKLPSRTYFSETAMPALWKRVTDRVKCQLRTAEYVAITTDSWTSRATENYVAVTAHFINTNWEVENYTLETKQFSESHTAANLATCLKETVTHWQLERNGKGPAITTDNASNIVRAVKESDLGPHIGCFAHTLNLATQRGLKTPQADRLLGRVRRVVTYFHKSTSATSSLKIMQSKLDVPQHKLLLDVKTRWNSSLDMCERYLEQQAPVYAALIELKKTSEVTLSENDVQNLRELVTILKPMKTVTTIMCSQKHPTASLIHPLKEMLLKHLEISATDNTLVSEIKKAISTDLKPRYCGDDILGLLLQSSALDPRFKSLPYLDPDARCDVYDCIEKAVNTLKVCQVMTQNVPVKPDPDDTPTTSESSVHVTPTLEEGEPPVKIKKESLEADSDCATSRGALADLFGDVFVTKVELPKSSLEIIRAELTAYKDEECLPLDSEISDPLLWWKEKADKYPILSQYANQLLGIPATSVASERVFSTAGDVVTAQRACLSGEQVDMLVFLKHNIKIPDDLI